MGWTRPSQRLKSPTTLTRLPWSPDGEVNAADRLSSVNHVERPSFSVSVRSGGLRPSGKIEFAEDDGKSIRIERFKGIAEVRAPLNLVIAWEEGALVRGPRGFEKAFGTSFKASMTSGGERTPFDGVGVKEIEASAAQVRKKRTVQLPSMACGPRRAKGNRSGERQGRRRLRVESPDREVAIEAASCVARCCSDKSDVPQPGKQWISN